jgi:hypothetical protein
MEFALEHGGVFIFSIVSLGGRLVKTMSASNNGCVFATATTRPVGFVRRFHLIEFIFNHGKTLPRKRREIFLAEWTLY